MRPLLNKAVAPNSAIGSCLRAKCQWRGVGGPQRSPKRRAERAKLKSCKDDTIVAQGKRSAALGYRRKMISFFPSGLARVWRAKPEGKKEVGVVWRFTQGDGLGGLALGYYHAAPRGASEAT